MRLVMKSKTYSRIAYTKDYERAFRSDIDCTGILDTVMFIAYSLRTSVQAQQTKWETLQRSSQRTWDVIWKRVIVKKLETPSPTCEKSRAPDPKVEECAQSHKKGCPRYRLLWMWPICDRHFKYSFQWKKLFNTLQYACNESMTRTQNPFIWINVEALTDANKNNTSHRQD